jgi:hypothetical protein
VATWAQFEVEPPDMAEVAARHWPGIVALDRDEAPPHGVPCLAISYLASVPPDGRARVQAWPAGCSTTTVGST